MCSGAGLLLTGPRGLALMEAARWWARTVAPAEPPPASLPVFAVALENVLLEQERGRPGLWESRVPAQERGEGLPRVWGRVRLEQRMQGYGKDDPGVRR